MWEETTRFHACTIMLLRQLQRRITLNAYFIGAIKQIKPKWYIKDAPSCVASIRHYHFKLNKGPQSTYLEITWLLAYILSAGTLISVMLPHSDDSRTRLVHVFKNWKLLFENICENTCGWKSVWKYVWYCLKTENYCLKSQTKHPPIQVQ